MNSRAHVGDAAVASANDAERSKASATGTLFHPYAPPGWPRTATLDLHPALNTMTATAMALLLLTLLLLLLLLLLLFKSPLSAP
jgi:hypothetical protein